jgi:uncharacterized protein involved in outer membrane biogenesis
MSKGLKITLYFLIAVVAVIVIAAVSLKLYFTQDRLKALILPKVEEAIQREVSVGDIGLKLFPVFGVKIRNLTISNPCGERFDRDQFVNLDELVLAVKVTPLLKKQVRINEIAVRSPRIYLEVRPDGINNFTFPADTTKKIPETETGAPPKQAFALFLSDFTISDGEIQYVDKSGDQRAVISGYQQKMKATATHSGQIVSLESQTEIGGLSYGSAKSFLISNLPLTSYQKLTYDGTQGALTLDSVQIGLKQIGLVLKGKITDLNAVPNLDLSLHSTGADIEQLLSFVPPEFLKASAGLTTTGKFQFALEIKGPAGETAQPGITGTFRVDNGTIRYTGLPKSITGINFAGSFNQPAQTKKQPQPGRLTIETFAASLGSNTLNGRLNVVNFADPVLTATFSGGLNLAEIKEYYPLEKGTELGGGIKADLSLNGRAASPENLKAEGKVEFQNVSIKTAATEKPLRNLNGVITFNNQVIDAKQIVADIGQSDMALSFTVRNYLGLVLEGKGGSGKPSARATLKSKLFRTQDVISSQPASAKSGEKQPASAPLLPDIDIDADVSIAKLVTGKFEFDNAQGAVQIRDGVINLQNFSLNAFGGAITTRGKLALKPDKNHTFDFNLDIRNVQANALLSNFTSFGNHLFGGFSMNGSLAGALNDTLGLKPQTLGGGGSVEIKQGQLIGYPLTASLASYTGISQLKEISFNNWNDSFKIENGRLRFGELKIAARDADFVITGSQGLDGTLDYKMLLKLPPGLSSQLKIQGLGSDLLSFLKDKDGRVNLSFLVGGTAKDPKLSLDQKQIEDAAKKALEQKAREQLDKTQQDLMKKAEDELKKLFGK